MYVCVFTYMYICVYIYMSTPVMRTVHSYLPAVPCSVPQSTLELLLSRTGHESARMCKYTLQRSLGKSECY